MRTMRRTTGALALGGRIALGGLMVLAAGCRAASDAGARLDLREASDGNLADGGALGRGGPTRYPAGILHSPMTRAVIDRLQAVLAAGSGQSGVFSKIGDSITADPNFLDCFAGSDVELDQYGALEPTRAFFAATVVDGTHTSFDRTSLAATVGWTAAKALAGSPSPIDQEVAAISPALAVVMFGTNETDPCCVASFERNLTSVVDALLAHSVVPLLSSIPPRGDSTANALVPEMNAVVRVVAQRRQVPYMDLWQRLIGLNRYGLAPDGVHPQSYVSGGAHPCLLTPTGLTEGMNQRNLLTLQALDRARTFLEESAPAEDAPPPLDGAGTWEAPRVVDALPFVDVGDTSQSSTSVVDVYSCAPQNEGGPEIVYEVRLTQAATLRARVFEDPGVDVDLMWLDAPAAGACLQRADNVLDIQAQPGTYYLAIDTFVSGQPKAGPYRLTLVQL
jgi:hypothetical protein